MNPTSVPALNRKRIVLAAVVIVIVAGVLLYFVVLKKPLPKLTSGPRVSTKTEYKNPFDKKTQYVNPFDNYKNPFAVAK